MARQADNSVRRLLKLIVKLVTPPLTLAYTFRGYKRINSLYKENVAANRLMSPQDFMTCLIRPVYQSTPIHWDHIWFLGDVLDT